MMAKSELLRSVDETSRHAAEDGLIETIRGFGVKYNLQQEQVALLQSSLEGVQGEYSEGFLQNFRNYVEAVSFQLQHNPGAQDKETHVGVDRIIRELYLAQKNNQNAKDSGMAEKVIAFLSQVKYLGMRKGVPAAAEFFNFFYGNFHTQMEKLDHKIEEMERVIDAQMEFLLLNKRHFNHGANGIIYRLSLGDITPTLQEALQERGIALQGDAAIKMLKVYEAGKGLKEYEMQQKAAEILNSSPESAKNRSLVPAPLLYRKLDIHPETRKKLNTEGARLESDHIEVLIMDYVEGRNLLHIILKEALIAHNRIVKEKGADQANSDQPWDVSQGEVIIPEDDDGLYSVAARVFRFADHAVKGQDILEGGKQAHNEWQKDLSKVVAFLASHGFRLPRAVEQQLTNSIRMLNDSNFYHKDLHERNVLASGLDGLDQDDVRTWIIDFGLAGPSDEHTPKERDMGIVGRLKPILAK